MIGFARKNFTDFFKAKDKKFYNTSTQIVIPAHNEIIFQCLSSKSIGVEKQVLQIMKKAIEKVLHSRKINLFFTVESAMGNIWLLNLNSKKILCG